jgi:hypothetical protein
LNFSDKTRVKNPRRTPAAAIKSETQKFTKNITKPAKNAHKVIRVKIVFLEGLSKNIILISLDNISQLLWLFYDKRPTVCGLPRMLFAGYPRWASPASSACFVRLRYFTRECLYRNITPFFYFIYMHEVLLFN